MPLPPPPLRPRCSRGGAAALVVAAPAAAQVNDYENRYGLTVEVSLDTILQMPEQYVDKAVRTRGQLDMYPMSTQLTYCLRGTFGGRLLITPVTEASYDWERNARQWVGKEVEITGAIGMGTSNGQQVVYMLLWGYLGPPDDKAKKMTSAQVTLEDLVTKPGKLDGKMVTVKGQFRGSNLFGDLPSASRRRSADWVIKEDLFAAWVTGHKSKGAGFELDKDMKRDSGKWLEITGRVSTEKGVVTIEATDVTLTKPPSATADAAPAVAAPPPPPPRGRSGRRSSSSRCRSTASGTSRRRRCSRSSSARTWTRPASGTGSSCATPAARSRATATSTPCASRTTRACGRFTSTRATSSGRAA